MNIFRVFALLKRNILLSLSGIALIEVFFWPFVDLVVWGFAARSMVGVAGKVATVLLVSIFFWRLALRCCFNISLLLINEFNARGFVNLFASPITFGEWIAAAMLAGCIDAIPLSIFVTGVIWMLYGILISSFGPLLILFMIPLLMSGWLIGILSASLLLHYGVVAQRLVWLTPWVFVPFSGVYYSVASLPTWAASIAHCLPMPYALEGLAIFITDNKLSWSHIGMAYGLASMYLIGALVFFEWIFQRSRVRGLARLEE